MDEWRRCGEGFSGVKKLSRIINSTPIQVAKKTEVDRLSDAEAAVTIVSKDSPEQEKQLKSFKNKSSSRGCYSNFQNKCSGNVKEVWKPGVFFEDFKDSTTGSSPQHSIEIECPSSSSSCSDTNDTSHETEEDASFKSRNGASRKRQGDHKRRCKLSKNSPLLQCSENSKMRGEAKKARHDSISNIQPVDNDPNSDAVENKSSCTQNKHDVSRWWTVSTFEQLDKTQRPQVERSSGFVVATAKCSGTRESHSKPKVVRRLHPEMSQNSPGFISDVESDSEGQENKDDTLSLKQPHVDHLSGRDNLVPIDSPVLQLQDDCPQILCAAEISPASSPAQIDMEGNSPPAFKDSQVSIDSERSSQSCQSQQRNTIKASDWLPVLQRQTTPVKDRDAQRVDHQDSAKKKRKFSSGSLAERLSRIQRRQKSSVRMWYHSAKTAGLCEKDTRSITAHIQHIDKMFSLYLCECQVSGDQNENRTCKVFFSKERAESLSLAVGMRVQIYPPWQLLETSSGERTFLCTEFVRVVSSEDALTGPGTDSSHAPNSTHAQQVKAVWSCPCAKDPRLPSSSCPVMKWPSTVLSHQQFKHRDMPVLDHYGNNHASSGAVRFQSVHCLSPQVPLGLVSGDSTVPVRRRVSVKCRTLQESRELLQSASDVLPAFSALILRVFLQRSLDQKVVMRQRLLLVDSAGTIAIATLPSVLSSKRDAEQGDKLSESTEAARLHLGHLEGNTCTCRGFRVAKRITKDQDAKFFSVLEEAWPFWCRSNCQSQDETDSASTLVEEAKDLSQQTTSRLREAPTFAYVLQTHSDMSGSHVEPGICNQVLVTEEECGEYQDTLVQKTFCCESVNKAIQRKTGDRVTFLAKLAFCYKDETSGNSSRSLSSVLVYDQEMDGCGHSALHTLYLGTMDHLIGRISPSVCLFRDVCYREGRLQCDEYTLVLPQIQWSSWGFDRLLDHREQSLVQDLSEHPLSVPKLTIDATEGMVVCLEGIVNAVDEESACVLEECSVCGSDLIVPDFGPMHCPMCGDTVHSSVSVMRMAAYLTCPGVDPDTVIKVQFAEKTIQNILPAEADEDGYDVDQVIGRSLACGACVVDSNTQTGTGSSKRIILLGELECT